MDIGLRPDESPKIGAVYPYSRCYCGFGKFVILDAGGPSRHDKTQASAIAINTFEKIRDARYDRLPVEKVHPNPIQPRRFFEAEALRGLSESIRTIGQLEDVLVRPIEDGYELVLGERRWRAIKLAGIERIAAKIVELDDHEARAISLVENLHRQDLTKVEEAFAFKSYVDEGHSLHDVGSGLGGMEDRVADSVKTLNSNYFVKFQEEQIRNLERTVEALRNRLASDAGHVSYEAKLATADELVYLIEEGFEIVATLNGGSFIVRRRKREI